MRLNNERILLINDKEFYPENDTYYVFEKLVANLQLSQIPENVTINLVEKVAGTRNDYYSIEPWINFSKQNDGCVSGLLTIPITKEDFNSENFEETVLELESRARKNKDKHSLSKYISVLKSKIYDDIAYYNIQIDFPDLTFSEANDWGREVRWLLDENEMEYSLEENQYKLFICHASEDKSKAEYLYQRLNAKGIIPFFDKYEILIGDSLIDKIQDALGSTNGLIVLLSKTSVDKPWVTKEINSFIHRKMYNEKLKVFPIVVEECDIPLFISEYRYADFTKDVEQEFNELWRAIKSHKQQLKY